MSNFQATETKDDEELSQCPYSINSSFPMEMNIVSIGNDELSDQLNQIDTLSIPQVPSFVEKYTSFQSRKSPLEICQLIIKTVKKMPNVEFKFIGKTSSFIGTFNGSVRFQINLFKNENGYMIECQRIYGDRVDFNEFYKMLVKPKELF